MLSYSIIGSAKQVCIVIGSINYYQQTFDHALYPDITFVYCNHRGFEQNNTKQQQYSLATLVQDIEDIRQYLKLQHFILLGHSIHAFIATEYAKQYPQYVSHLIYVASSPIIGEIVHQACDAIWEHTASVERKHALEHNMSYKHHSNIMINRMLTFAPMIWYDYTFNASYLWRDMYINPAWSQYIWEECFKHYNILNTIPMLKCPILLVLGKYDFWNPVGLWPELNTIPNMTGVLFDKSGHTPQLEESEKFASTMLSWLEAHKSK